MNPMFHRHLVAAYAVTWIVQLSYLAYAARKWVAARKAQREIQKNRPSS
ncbi:MAG TPA: hypothetical protein VMD58_08485 [Acidobacteriaceae bacterium]|nr:hypothetical protein [Acidobacteriaceae bacterium]